ncbi:MAG TPA: endonuclease/exonuclease/phosphatase family protein [Verrucomicrobiae bacterium]|nr:endonuclease/exonuclease/phosphatase family protein [Verrucomicrobiae bacterium]
MKKGIRVFVLAFLAAFAGHLFGQVPMGSGTYSQDFNTLFTSGKPEWIDNSTLPSWYASKTGGPPEITNYVAGSGSGTTGGLYSFGQANASDRSLGSLASGGTGTIAYGVRLINETQIARTDVRVSYTGEQWRAGGTGTQKLSFSFVIGTGLTNADADSNLDWTRCSELDFISPVTNVTQALDGNDVANRVEFAQVLLPGVLVAPGQELFLRWVDTDDAGYDHALGIDGLSISSQPVDTNLLQALAGAFSLLTYNTHGNQVENWSTNSYQVRAIGRQLVYLQPDIACFNEIPDTNTYQMENWVKAFLPGYFLATNSESDGFIRNAIASRFPIVRSQSWLHGSDLSPYGCTNAIFKRDLFEAEIAVPGFAQPLHVFSIHLKSGQDGSSSTERAAEAGAISNFLATSFIPSNGFQPYVVCGDLNEDLARPPANNPQTLQRLIAASTGLRLISPVNWLTQSELTFSIQSGTPTKRYDYILPCALLSANLSAAAVFRTDLLTNPPFPVRTNDDRLASDHLPLIVSFNNPYDKPFRIINITRNESGMGVRWESVPGQKYSVEESGDLRTWTAICDEVAASESTCDFTAPAEPGRCFLRVRRSR